MKTLRILGAMALCAVMIPSLTSCSDDDDDKGGDGTGGVLEIEGERLTSIGTGYGSSYSIDYDSKGRVASVNTSYGSMVINYSKGTIALEASNNDQERYTVKFNDKGYISELNSSWNETYTESGDKYQVKGSGTVTFSYNGSGNLASITSKSSETEKDLSDGSTSKYSETYTTKLTWTNGNMVKAVCKGTEIEDGEKEAYTETYEVEYSTTPNKFRQNPVAISKIANDGTEWNVLAAAGLFGKGPKQLPTVVDESDDDGYSHTKNVSYTLNSVGSISAERVNYATYNYYYNAVDRSANFGEGKPFGSVRNLFVKAKRHK